MFRTKRAADTALNIDFDHLLKLGVFDTRNDFDTVDGAKDNAG